MRARLSALLTLAVLGTAFTGAQAGSPPATAVRVAAGGLSEAGVTPAWSASYGAFEWAEVRQGDLAALRSSGVPFEPHPEAGTLVLPGGTLDPAAASLPALTPGRPQLHVIQLRGPSKDAWLDELRARGVSLVQFVAPFGYVALLDPADTGAVRDLGFVRAVIPFTPELRFGKLEVGAGGQVGVVVLDDGRVDATVRAIGGLAEDLEVTETIPFMDVDATGLSVVATAAALPRIAALPNVYSISPVFKGQSRDEMSDQIVAGNYNASNVPQDGYPAWLTAKGVNGAGVVVAHVDDGYSTAHPDSLGTVAGCRDYSVPNGACQGTTGVHSDFHGQHTGGIIVGTGTAPADDASGFRYGLGVAPGAQLYVQNFISLRAFFGYSGAGQYQRLNRDSVLGGGTISANSWGPAGSPRGYDADTREFDFAPRDANLDTPQHEPLAFVLSIMNGNGSGPGGAPTQGTPDEGKNLLRVGSTKNYRAGPINDLSTSSAHGPALDGRRLPDVVAPGQNVVSTANPGTIGLCLSPVVGPWAGLYSGCTGTSMASPHVSGASALFTEWWKKSHAGQNPSPALQKAAFVNGAVDLSGARDADG
ncbi:MAG TPA: S8 family serine peptidase, partial [Actinomycetota bacterium]